MHLHHSAAALLLLTACSSSDPVEAQASLGPDLAVEGGRWVVLTGKTANGSFLQRRWQQLSGPPVEVLGEATNTLAFSAPQLDAELVFEFALVQGLTVLASDVIQVSVSSTRRGGAGMLHAMLPVAGGESGGVAFHPATARLYALDPATRTVAVWDLSDLAAPTEESALDLGAWSAGNPSALALADDVLAVALTGDAAGAPGVLQLWDAVTQGYVDQVATGPDPVDVALDAGGQVALVACAGAPSDDYAVDPAGSITWVDVPGASAVQLGFEAWNGQEDALRAAGVRVFGPDASASQDLEPESVTLAADGRSGWVVCQENNALAALDLVTGAVTDVRSLATKDWGAPGLARAASLAVHPWTDLKTIGTTTAGQDLARGGLTGLTYTGEVGGRLRFLTTGGRGPTLDAVDVEPDGAPERPFALPDHQLSLLRLELHPMLGALDTLEVLPLWATDGVTPLTGRPNLLADGGAALAHNDEWPVDLFGAPLVLDPLGLDPQAVVELPDGTFWVADDYRPSLAHFDAGGVLLARHVPVGSNASGPVVGTETLPAVYAQRRRGFGFAGLTYDPARARLQVWMRGSLDNPDTTADAATRVVRVLEFDPVAGAVMGEFTLVADAHGGAGVGDAAWAGSSGEYLVLEGNGGLGAEAGLAVHRVSFAGATNLFDLGPDYDAVAGPGGVLEATAPEDLSALGVTPVTKRLQVNLADAGVTTAPDVGGLARLPNDRFALLADDGHGLFGAAHDLAAGTFTPDAALGRVAALTLVTPVAAGFDASDADDALAIEAWPVRAMRQPDQVARLEVDGVTYLATADEGAPRVTGAFDERARVGEVILDTLAFPDAATLQQDDQLGRLEVTKENGDVDGDGDYDELWAFGARGFTIWTTDGARVADSSDGLAREMERAAPAFFNSEGTSDTFDVASPERGPEPESLVHGEVAGVPYLFVGLARLGVVAVYDVRNPAAPKFATFVGTPGEATPADLRFVPASESPNGAPLLVVSFAGTGTVAVYELEL